MSDAQRRSTAVGVAGIYQLSRFNALMLNMSMANDAATTSMNSQGSAMREQEKYNQSLEARINRLNTAWYSLSATVGDTLLYDTIVVLTQGLESLTKNGEDGARKLSILPPILTTIGLATFMLSTRFRNLAISIALNTSTMLKSITVDGIKTLTTRKLTFAMNALRMSVTGLVAMTGVGLLFMGIGIAAEVATRKMSENIQKNEEFEAQQAKNITAMSENRAETEELIETYKRLSDEKQNSNLWSTTREEEYLEVQRRLAETFPALISYTDSSGKAHLKSAELIEKEVAITDELIKKKQQLEIVNAEDTFKNRLSEISDALDDIEKKRKKADGLSTETTNRRDDTRKYDNDEVNQKRAELEFEMQELYESVFQKSQEMASEILKIASYFSEIEINPVLADEIERIVTALDFNDMSAEEVERFTKELGRLEEGITKATEANDKLEYDRLNKELIALFETTKGYDSKLSGTIPTISELIAKTEALANANGMVQDGLEEGTYELQGFAKKIEDVTASLTDYKNLTEEIAGVTQSQIDNTSELLMSYYALTSELGNYNEQQLRDLESKQFLSFEEQNLVNTMNKRTEVMQLLQAMYPDLINLQGRTIALTGEQIQAIEDEHFANQVLYESYKNVYAGKYTAEQRMTLASKSGTEARIANLNAEIRALQTMVNAYNNMYRGLMSSAGTSDPEVLAFMQREANKAKAATAQISNLRATVSGLRGDLNTTYKQLNSFNTALGGGITRSKGGGSFPSSSKSSSSKDKSGSTDALKEAVYISDKLKLALEKVNAEIEKQEILRSKYPEHADEYIKSIEKQRNLEKEKLSLLKQQEKSLAEQIKKGKLTEYGKVVTNGKSKMSKSEAEADKKQALEQARSELLQLQQEILKQEQMMNELDSDLINSNLAKFNAKRSQRDKAIEFESARLKELDRNSANYAKSLKNVTTQLIAKQNVNREEVDYLTKIIKSGTLYGEALEEMTNRVDELKLEMLDLISQIQENEYEIVIHVKTQFDEKLSDNTFEFDKLTRLQERLTEGTKDWLTVQREKIRLQKVESETLQKQKEAIQGEIRYRDLSAEKLKELKEQLQSISLAYDDSINSERNLAEELVKSQESAADDLADTLWGAYQEYLEQRKTEHLKAIDQEIKSEEERYKKRIKNLDDEMDLFRKNTQERIALIDKEEADRDYQMDMDDLNLERETLVSQIDDLMLDNSREAVKRRKDLQKQLDDLDKQIAEKQRDRQIDFLKESLNESLTAKEASIEQEKQLEEDRYNQFVEIKNREKEYYEKYYEDLENDERKYAQLREDIMSGSWGKITEEFGTYIGQMIDTMPLLADSMDGTMESVGTAIRQNVIENLQEALRLLAEFQGKNDSTIDGIKNGNPVSSGSNPSTGGNNPYASSTINNSDMKVLLGKFMYETLAKTESNSTLKKQLQAQGEALAAQGRSGGSKLVKTIDLNTYLAQLSKDDLENFSKFVQANANYVVSSPSLQDYLKDFAKRLLLSSARLSSGGMIPNVGGLGLDGKGGRGVIVHPNEVINTPYDTENLINMAKIMQSAVSYLNPLIHKLNDFSPTSNLNGNGQLAINFYVDKMVADEQSANTYGNKIGNILRTKFGRSLD